MYRRGLLARVGLFLAKKRMISALKYRIFENLRYTCAAKLVMETK